MKIGVYSGNTASVLMKVPHMPLLKFNTWNEPSHICGKCRLGALRAWHFQIKKNQCHYTVSLKSIVIILHAYNIYLKLEYLEFSSLSPIEAARAGRAEGALGWQGQKLVTYKEMSN